MGVEVMILAAIIAELAPRVWSLVKKAEEFIPEAKMGKIKKQLVLDALLNDGFDIADKLIPGIELKVIKPVIEKALSKLIDSTVTVLNSVKYFDRIKLNPADFGNAQTGFMRTGLNIFLAVILSLGLMIVLFGCGGTKVGTDSATLYSGEMIGEGPTALFVTGACNEAHKCAGGSELVEGLPNLKILGPIDSTHVVCRGALAGSCYEFDTRTVVLPSNPNEEAIKTACLYDWSMQTTGDPDFERKGEPWTQQCNKPFRIVE